GRSALISLLAPSLTTVHSSDQILRIDRGELRRYSFAPIPRLRLPVAGGSQFRKQVERRTALNKAMTPDMRMMWRCGRPFALALLIAGVAAAQTTLTQISNDTFTNTTSQHETEVEPSSFAVGSTIVSAFQMGRFTDGGASDIGFATSTDGGSTWTHGNLPGITK